MQTGSRVTDILLHSCTIQVFIATAWCFVLRAACCVVISRLFQLHTHWEVCFEPPCWLAVFIYICGACTAFMMICGSSFQALLQRFILYRVSDTLPAVLSARWLSILIPSALIILPLSLLPSMAALAATSTLALAVYSFNIAAVASEFIGAAASAIPGAPIIPTHSEPFHWKLEAVKAIPIMIFAYRCHVQSVPIFAEMASAPRLLSCCGSTDTDAERSQNAATSKQQRVLPIFIMTFGQCTLMYTVMGVCGYLLFPVDTQSNILNNFGTDNNLMLVVRILVGFAVALHYPIDLHVARTALYDLVCGCLGVVPVHPAPYVSLAQCTAAIWSGSLVLACLVTDLGIVFQVLGGVACTLLIFILPGLMLLFDDASGVRGSMPLQIHSRENMEGGTEDSRGGEAAIDRIPLLPSSTGSGGRDQGSTADEDRAVDIDSPGVGCQVGLDVAFVSAVSGGQEGEGARGDGEIGCGTQVLGWFLVSFGSCIMLLTVYLTFFG